MWQQIRAANLAWLTPWEATAPPTPYDSPDSGTPGGYPAMVRSLRAQARAGTCLPFAVTYHDRFVGQLTVSGVTYGSARWAQIGYWIDQAYAGRGIIPTAVAMASDHCFFRLGLHRMEVTIRPENVASLRVVEKLGFHPEGMRRRYMHINGAWRDHLAFSLCAEDVPQGLLARWREVRGRHAG